MFLHDRIDIWPLDLAAGDLGADLELLSQAERERANRFKFDLHRNRFVRGRARVRRLLASYLRQPPEAIAMVEGARGKPALALTPGLHFNVSHCEDLGLLAVTQAAPIGVDVERVRPVEAGLAEACFSTAELAALARVTLEDREAAFFRGWTRKEAVLKALGDGLWQPLDAFDVTLSAKAAPAVLGWAGDAAAAQRWRLFHLEPAPGFIGAAALQGAPGPLEVFWRNRAPCSTAAIANASGAPPSC